MVGDGDRTMGDAGAVALSFAHAQVAHVVADRSWSAFAFVALFLACTP